MNIPEELSKNGIVPDPKKDQFFLVDEATIERTVLRANISANDTVLEIGAGVGNLTRALAARAGKVIVFEIDKAFTPLLGNIPGNVDLHFEDAWDYVQLHGKQRKKREFNKIVANLPYSFTEKLIHNLTFLEYDKVLLLVPLKSVSMMSTNPVFSSFFNPKLVEVVEKEKFYPIPVPTLPSSTLRDCPTRS